MVVLEDYNRSDAPVVQKQNEIRHRIFDSTRRVVASFVNCFAEFSCIRISSWKISMTYYVLLLVYIIRITMQHVQRDIYNGFFHKTITAEKEIRKENKRIKVGSQGG